jgi:hypothetical protein
VPPLPLPPIIQPNLGRLSPLQVQEIDHRIFRRLGITSHGGFSAVLSPIFQVALSVPLDPPFREEAFFGGQQLGPFAGNFSHVQCWNPADSGVYVVITSMFVSSAGLGAGVRISFGNAALTTLVSTFWSKVPGSAGSRAQLRTQNAAAEQGTIMTSYFTGAANTSSRVPFTEPFILRPGWGLHCNPAAVNVQVHGGFEFYEVDTGNA